MHQGQANKSGVTLTRPATSWHESTVKYFQTGRPTSLKPRLVTVGPLENVEGYAVWTGKRNTGLTLVSEVRLAADGQAQVNKSHWYVNYDRAGKPVAAPTIASARRGVWLHSWLTSIGPDQSSSLRMRKLEV